MRFQSGSDPDAPFEDREAVAENRPPPMFIADALGLDFLNTIATPEDRPIEWLASGEDLLGWLEQAGLLLAEEAAELRKSAFPGELDAVAAQARALREWFRGFVAAHRGKPLTGAVLDELQPLNHVLERDEGFGAIVARSGAPIDHAHELGEVAALEWRPRRRWRTPASLLLPIAQAMADVICAADFAMIKECEGPSCTIVFLDTTRGHARRWCSMAACGNRAKQAAHRRRARRA